MSFNLLLHIFIPLHIITGVYFFASIEYECICIFFKPFCSHNYVVSVPNKSLRQRVYIIKLGEIRKVYTYTHERV